MHAAAYQHYALDYGLAAAILLVLFCVLIVVAKLDGDRRRRSEPEPSRSPARAGSQP